MRVSAGEVTLSTARPLVAALGAAAIWRYVGEVARDCGFKSVYHFSQRV